MTFTPKYSQLIFDKNDYTLFPVSIDLSTWLLSPSRKNNNNDKSMTEKLNCAKTLVNLTRILINNNNYKCMNTNCTPVDTLKKCNT